jgi:hypothetical protein
LKPNEPNFSLKETTNYKPQEDQEINGILNEDTQFPEPKVIKKPIEKYT